jgi:hypothetical protein
MTNLFAIENLTVLEVSELVKATEEQFGVRAAKAAKKAAKKLLIRQHVYPRVRSGILGRRILNSPFRRRLPRRRMKHFAVK